MKTITLLSLLLSSSLGATTFLPRLKPVTLSEINARLVDVKKAQLVPEAEVLNFKTIGVPWSYIYGNNCGDRADLTEVALAMKDKNILIPKPLTKSLTDLVLNQPAIESGGISLLGNMRGVQKINLLDRRQLSYPISWGNHEARVVNVSGKLMVVDLSANDKVLPIDQWVKIFAPASCAQHLSDEEAHAIKKYDICRGNGWVPGTAPKCEAPKYACGYLFRPKRKYTPGYDPKLWGTFPAVISAASFAMSSDMSKLLKEASDLDPIRELPFLRSTFIQEK